MFTALRGSPRPVALHLLLLIFALSPFVLLAAAEKEPPSLPHLLESALVEGVEMSDLALRDLSLPQLRLLRNTVYARHGRVFTDDSEMQKYFVAKTWYQPSPKYDHEMLTPEDHRNIAALLSQEGRPEDAHWQETVALAKQAEEMAEVANSLEVLNAYLTDQQAVEYGEAPEDFEQPPLSVYKEKEIVEPLTSP